MKNIYCIIIIFEYHHSLPGTVISRHCAATSTITTFLELLSLPLKLGPLPLELFRLHGFPCRRCCCRCCYYCIITCGWWCMVLTRDCCTTPILRRLTLLTPSCCLLLLLLLFLLLLLLLVTAPGIPHGHVNLLCLNNLRLVPRNMLQMLVVVAAAFF